MSKKSDKITQSPVTGPGTQGEMVRDLLGQMKATLGTLDKSLLILNEQSLKVSSIGSTMDDSSKQISEIRTQIQTQAKRHDKTLEEVKKMIRDDIKGELATKMMPHITERIRVEIAVQVKHEIDTHITEYIPVPLKSQAAESQRDLVEVKHALHNSKARRRNSEITKSNLGDRLAVVHKLDGTKSEFYPADLHSLFAYDAIMLGKLLTDHKLFEHEQRERNLNRFMAHIGIGFQLVPLSIPRIHAISTLNV